MPTLYIVATPIGNLEDITLRALRVLGEVRLIAAEDTRTTRKLLTRYEIRTRLTSYHDHNRVGKIPVILQALEEGDVALVSDAGTPVVSDPGLELVRAAAERGILVVPVPGPSSVTTALAASGLSGDRFLFLGFPSRRKGERVALLRSVAGLPHTLVLFEAPHRLRQTLSDILDALGDRPMAAVREVTKLYEEVFRGSVSECLKHFAQPRGEFTLVIGAGERDEPASAAEAEATMRGLLEHGVSPRDARARVVSELGMSRREAYRLWLRLKGGTGDGA